MAVPDGAATSPPANSRHPPPARRLPARGRGRERPTAHPAARLRNVATDDCDAAVGKGLERAMHPHAEIAAPLGDARHPQRPAEPSMVRRDRQQRAEASVGGQGAQQPRQRRDVEPQRRAVADLPRQPPFYRSQAGGTGKYHPNVSHP